ncbi:MAG: hypothetical protein Q9207_008134, partial [Kuettlingeria erythrocarpa]
MFRLTFTVVLRSLTVFTLKAYEQKGTVGHDHKIVLNTVITVFNLALGLNFPEAFKGMAKVLRWRVLANWRFTVRETDLMLGGEILKNLATLMRESMKRPFMCSVCAFWDNGVDLTGVTTAPGMVSLAKIDCYYNNGRCITDPDQPPEVAQNVAHSYGAASLRERACPYTTDDDILRAPQNCTCFANKDGQGFAYRYNEYNPHDRARAYPHLTERLVRTFPGQCFQYKTGGEYQEESPDGTLSIQVWSYSNETTDGLLRAARTDTVFDSTTYAYTGVEAPQNASALSFIAGAHCVLIALTLSIARPVVVPADSNLVVAKLSNSLVRGLGKRGTLLDAKEVAEAIENAEDGDEAVQRTIGTVGYGVREGSYGTALEIGEALTSRKSLGRWEIPAEDVCLRQRRNFVSQ